MKHQAIFRTGTALVTATSLVALAAALSSAQTTGQTAASRSKTDPKINDAFKKPDVKAYIKKFESEDREPYARRHEIVAALELKPGMVAADIGAGTGLFTRLMAEKVGDQWKGLRRRYRAGIPCTHRSRRQEKQAAADHHGAGNSANNQSSQRRGGRCVF